MDRKLYLFLAILFSILRMESERLYGQNSFASQYHFSYLTMDNGLLHNDISHIYKDRQGFVWISTRGGGLSRYDGYGFTHFNASTSRINLKSNFITSVCEDDFHRLWIISDEGTDLLDLRTLQKTSLPGKSRQHVLPENVAGLLKDSRGNIWLCGESSLHKIRFDSKGEIASVRTLPHLEVPALNVALNDADKDGNVWLGCGNTIYKVAASGSRALALSPLIRLDAQASIHTIRTKGNEVWIGTNIGLYRYDRKKGTLRCYRRNGKDIHSIVQNNITDILIAPGQQVIASTLGGINVYDPLTDRFERITKKTDHPGDALNSDFINCLFTDGTAIWAGSDVGGINRMTPRRLSFRSYVHDDGNPYSLSQNPVNAIYEDRLGNLWVGTVEGGLNKKAKGSEQFIHYSATTAVALSHNTVSSIIADDRNRLWIGTWGWGITLLDPAHPGGESVRHLTPSNCPGFPIALIESLCYDSINHGIWIGANPGIFFYDLTKDRLIKPFDPDITYSVHKALGTAIDSRGKLWIGSVKNGMFVIDLHSRRGDKFSYTHLKYKLDHPESGLQERITCLYKGSDGTLWIGSNGNGFYKYDAHSTGRNPFTAYNSKNGLVNNNIRGILEDDKGLIWISTNYGLSRFDPVQETFTNYTKEDGLVDNQFYWNAFYKSKDGTLYFGGINGLTVLSGSITPPAKELKNVVFTRLSLKNEEVFAGCKGLVSDISMTRELHIHERDNSFSLEFSALDYEPDPTATYSYRLLGFEDKWIEIPVHRRYAGYTNIPPGTYTLQVKYNAEGKSSSPGNITELRIVIEPFFYKTGWFITLVVLLTGCTIAYVYVRRLYFLQKQKQLLHRMVEERTHELTEQNKKISRQKEQLIKMSRKVQELTLDKLSFFTNITHEFRTPVTLIAGPIGRALKLSHDPRVTEQLQLVERNANYLLSLVNQLMDFRKVESGTQEIVKKNADFLLFIDSLLVPFREFASGRHIAIREYYRIDRPVFPFDPDAMQKIITNLLSNAIKFTPDGGTIRIYAAILCAPGGQEKLFICVKDTGMGIQEEDLPQLFNRFYQGRNNTQFPVYGQSGTGIGLYLIRRITELHGGNITAHNNKKAGSSFRIVLPIERETESRPADTPSRTLPQSEKTHSASPLLRTGDQTILIVEDNPDMRRYIRSILEAQYNTLEAENGKKALEMLSAHKVDFIISDLMMPVMDGIELSRKVKQNFTISHIPFLMLTAKTSPETRLESYRTGVDEYIQKPFSEELLLARIRNILENRKRYQQRFALHMEVGELQIEEESKDKQFADRLIGIISKNYADADYGASDFINDMGISKSVLNRKMQELTGQSIGQFIRNYRLNIAYELIRKNRSTHCMNIAEIAYKTGFSDPKYFTRCFSKRYNTTPSKAMEEDPDTES